MTTSRRRRKPKVSNATRSLGTGRRGDLVSASRRNELLLGVCRATGVTNLQEDVRERQTFSPGGRVRALQTRQCNRFAPAFAEIAAGRESGLLSYRLGSTSAAAMKLHK